MIRADFYIAARKCQFMMFAYSRDNLVEEVYRLMKMKEICDWLHNKIQRLRIFD